MATIRERLVYAIEVVADKAGLRGFESQVAQAEGTVGRFKSRTGSAFDTIRQNAGLLAVAAGGAAVAIGTKLVGSFQDAALAAGKLSDATGLTVEDASRLQEVAGDLGVSTESLEGSIVKLNRAAGKGDLAKFGIDVKKAADGTTDVNATFLETIKVIQGIADPTEKALAAQAAFGRGYAQIAELIGTSAAELKDRLDSVADGRVINDRELKQAREFRDNVDDLKDSAEALGLTLGGVVVPALNDVISGFRAWFKGVGDAGAALNDFIRTGNLRNTHIVEEFNTGRDAARDFDMSLLDGLTTFEQVRAKVVELTGSEHAANLVALEWTRSQKELNAAAEDGADAIADLGDKAANSGPKIGDMAGALDDAEQKLADLNEEARSNALDALAAAAKAVGDAVETAFAKVRGDLDLQDLVDDITDQFGEVADAQAKLSEDGQEGIRNYNRSVRDLQRQLLTLLDSIKGIPPDKKVQVAAQIERGSVDDLYRILGDLTRGVVVPVSFSTGPTPAFSSVNGTFSPTATPSAPTFNPTQSAIPSSGYVDNRNITIINPIGSTPTTQYVDQQTDFRRNGIR